MYTSLTDRGSQGTEQGGALQRQALFALVAMAGYGLGARGRLNEAASESERRGEALFSRPFPAEPRYSCASCHEPGNNFTDNRRHDVGSGGPHKTPPLINANFNAPYFHDGRYDTFDQVVDHFDRSFGLELSEQDRRDLVAHLRAIGDARQPYDSDSVIVRFKEIDSFSLLLGQAIAAGDHDVIALAIDTLGSELRDLVQQFPDHRNTAVSGALVERRMARAAVKDAVISLRRIATMASADDLGAAAAEYKTYHDLTFSRAMPLLRGAEPWSLFNPRVREAHDAQRRQMLRAPSPPRRRDAEASR
jgi:Di-haem cytochrome c peroxidase